MGEQNEVIKRLINSLPWNILITLFNNTTGEITEIDISHFTAGVRPLLGEAIYQGKDRFVVVEVAWNFDKRTCLISATSQENPEEDPE